MLSVTIVWEWPVQFTLDTNKAHKGQGIFEMYHAWADTKVTHQVNAVAKINLITDWNTMLVGQADISFKILPQ